MKEFAELLDAIQHNEIGLDEIEPSVDELLTQNPQDANDYLDFLSQYHQKNPLPIIAVGRLTQRIENTLQKRNVANDNSNDDDKTVAITAEDKTVAIPRDDDKTVAINPDDDATIALADNDQTVVSTDTIGLESQGGGNGPVTSGSTLKDRFVLLEPLGEGGMGVVYKAQDLLKVEAQDKNPYVAIKILTAAFREHQDAFISLQREASKAQRLAHPNIGTVYDFDREGDIIYMTMELLEGMELKQHIKQLPQGGVSLTEALPIIEGLASALNYAHKNKLIHSDFKPGNAFVTNEGIVKVIDFGIARASKTKDTEGETTVFDPGQLGALTPAYATCEMFEGMDPHPSDDIYALGCICYEMLTGQHPYNKLSAPKAKDKKLKPLPIEGKGLSKRQQKTLINSVAFDRADRTQSIEEFIEGLRPRKSYVKQIATAATLLTLVIGGLAYIPIKNFLDTQANEKLVAALQSDNGENVSIAIEQLLNLEDETAQLAVAQATRDHLLNYFETQIEKAINPEADQYNYPQAEKIIAQAASLYPGSTFVDNNQLQLTEGKNTLLSELTEKLNLALKQSRFLPVDNQDDIVDVLNILSVAAPDHQLLRDPRISIAYAKAAEKAINNNNYQLADQLLTVGTRFFSSDSNLLNRADQVKTELLRLENTKLANAIIARLEDIKPQLNSLDAFLEVNEDIASLRRIQPESKLLASLDQTLKNYFDQSFTKAISAQAWDDAEQLLYSYALALNMDFLKNKRKQLSDAEGSNNIVNPNLATVKANLDNLIASSTFDKQWQLDIANTYKQLIATANAETLSTEQQRITETHLQHANTLKENNRYLGAIETIQAGQGLFPTNTALSTALNEIKAAETEYKKELEEQERLAEIEGLKQTLLTQAQANSVDKTIETYKQLNEILSKDDAFLLETAPQALEDMYLRKTTSLSNNEEFDEALTLINAGLTYLPNSETLKDAATQLKASAKFANISKQLLTQTKLNTQSINKQLAELKTLYADDYKTQETALIETLKQRIENLEKINLRRAHNLLNNAKKIWGNNKLIGNIRLKELPKPSVYAGKGIQLAEQGKLTAAQASLKQAKQKEPKHADVAQLQRLLSEKTQAAKNAFSNYEKQLSNLKYKDANKAIQKTLGLWSDNTNYNQAAKRIKTIMAKISAGAKLCEDKFAGFGKNSRASCYDIIGKKTRGPNLIVLNAGAGYKQPFAITKHEISNKDLSYFCKNSSTCSVNAAKGKLPATGVTPKAMEAYAAWLSKQTGFEYHLTTDAEWQYASTAGGKEGNNDYNCLLRLGSQVMKGQAMLGVTSGKPNRWGLVNYVGNAQELVKKGNNYVLRGGHYQDPMSSCSTKLSRPYTGKTDNLTGFRLTRIIH